MYKFTLFIFLLFCVNQVEAQSTRWKIKIDSCNIFSSPRFSDLNNDGTKDVIIGAGLENSSTQYGIIAFNGKNGDVLWNVETPTQIYTSALFQDITGDSIPDVFIGGRNACFYAINGATGEVIWQFWNKSPQEARDRAYLNFYSTQFIADQNEDGYLDLLVTNGGDVQAAPTVTNRMTANLMVLSSSDGSILAKAKMPEKRESYYAPHTYKKKKKTMVVFGTGGETIDGGLWEVPLKKLLKNKISKSTLIIRDTVKGFILNSVMTDLNGDSNLDIINARMNATISAIDGKKHKVLWEQSFDGYECYVTPCLGNFVGDNTLDVFTIIANGSFPRYTSFKMLIIDGNTGEISWEEETGFSQFSPGIAVDMNNDGTDEIVFIENKLIDMEKFTTTNQVKIIDITNNQSSLIGSERDGLSMASSPGIIDLESNGNYQIVVATTSISTGNNAEYSIIECIDIEDRPKSVTWPGYLGPFENGLKK